MSEVTPKWAIICESELTGSDDGNESNGANGADNGRDGNRLPPKTMIRQIDSAHKLYLINGMSGVSRVQP